jgi:hypothetical protein
MNPAERVRCNMRAQMKFCARYCNPTRVAAVAQLGHDARPATRGVVTKSGPALDGRGLKNFEERPRMSSERDTFRRRTRPNSVRRKQVNRS